MYNRITASAMNKNYKFVIMLGIVAVAISLLIPSCAGDESEVSVVETTTTEATTTTAPEPVTTEAPTTTVYFPPTTTTIYIAPPPTSPVATEPPPAAIPAGSIEEMICNTFGDQCQKALSVVRCESSFNPGTVGAAGERGLFQIHPVHIPYLQDRGMTWDSMFDPASNISYAYDLYSRSGWGPWTCA